MITPIKNIQFLGIQSNLKVKKQNIEKTKGNQANTSIPSIYDNSLKINFTSYMPIHEKMSFEEMVDKNFFGLPKVTNKQGELEQLMPDENQLACAKKLYEGKNVVFSAPTGMGKTAVAHFCINKNLEENKQTIYTVPIKALANDKYNEFKKIYGEDQVGILTGDRKINASAPILIMVTEIFDNQSVDLKLDEASKIGTVIHDEAHYIGDADRGAAWENSIMNSASLGVQTLALSATIGNVDELTDWIASVSTRKTENVVVAPEERPVPLVWQVYRDKSFMRLRRGVIDLSEELTDKKKIALDILNETLNQNGNNEELDDDDYKILYEDFKKAIEQDDTSEFKEKDFKSRLKRVFPELGNDKAEAITQLFISPKGEEYLTPKVYRKEEDIPELVDKLKQNNMLPAIIFKLSREACERTLQNIKDYNRDKKKHSASSNFLNAEITTDLLTPKEKLEIEKILKKYEDNGVYLGKKLDVDMLKKGWAVHHAGRIPQYKKLVEELFSKKLIKVVISTSTLGAGINMPAKTVVMTDAAYGKYNPNTEEVEFTPLSSNEFHQMAGRAGRRGIDNIGNVVLYNLHTISPYQKSLSTNKIDELQYAYKLINSGADDLSSSFKPEAPMIAQYYRYFDTPDRLEEIISSSFKVFLSEEKEKKVGELKEQFANFSQVLINEGYLLKDESDKVKITPKGLILSMCQGMNPIMLSHLLYEEKLNGIQPLDLCQIAGRIAGSDEEIESDEVSDVVAQKVQHIFEKRKVNEKLLKQFNRWNSTIQRDEYTIYKELVNAGIPLEDLRITNDYSAMVSYLFALMNKRNPDDTCSNFKEITAKFPNSASKLANKAYEKQNTEGNVYKIITGSITVLKQMINICDFAIMNTDMFPNGKYWTHIKQTAEKSLELLENEPINNEADYGNKTINK